MAKNEQIWRKSWDKGLDDLDPKLFEVNFVEAVKPAFERFPDKIALAFMGTEITSRSSISFPTDLPTCSSRNGLKKGDVVGINLPNIPEYVIAWLGTLKAGCVVSGVSPLLSTEEMEYQLKDSDARGLVTLDAIFRRPGHPDRR